MVCYLIDALRKCHTDHCIGFNTNDNPAKTEIMRRAIQQLTNTYDVPVVVAAGNGGSQTPMDRTTPQNLGVELNSFLTVGGVDRKGVFYRDTSLSGSLSGLDVYAGAVDVDLADPNNDNGYVTDTGTSFAAPAIVSNA